MHLCALQQQQQDSHPVVVALLENQQCMKNDDIQLKEENKETPCFLESLQLALWQYGLSIYSMDAYKIRQIFERLS